ncbi:MAG: arginine--tRNA ligase [Candidatus Acidiferrales bacterium]
MYQVFEKRIRIAIGRHIHKHYRLDVTVLTERPPRLEMGEVATPVCFELAKKLKKAPRLLAQEIANSIAPIEGVARLEVAGGGYLNAYLDRTTFFKSATEHAGREAVSPGASTPKTTVEHTSINPNKAAHIGHLRNAVLGDSFQRLLRHTGRRVEVQNYIDNTGVQVADVVLGFLHLEKKSAEEVTQLAGKPRFDYLCWDLYTRVTHYLEEDKSRLTERAEVLKEIEEGHGTAAKIAEIVSTAIVQCHLRTLDRLGIDYDLLSRESEILHLKFWDAAFELLKSRGAIQLAASGKNAGCWVMELPSDGRKADEEEESGEEAEAKIIVRSNGTVTYVGKDIAHHLWKFGLLERDFHYRRFHTHPDGHTAWVTSSEGDDPGAPEFGHAHEVFNVIDSRQAYPQQVVAQGLRALGYEEQANHLKHFAYNVVALTPRCAQEMGYEIPAEDAKKPYVEVSGRKGQGVKADDLLDRLEADARAEVDGRHADLPEAERAAIGHAIAIGALRYFLLRFTRTTMIAFDFKDALSFEGETGPYCQYAIVRARNIFRKLLDQEPDFRREGIAGRLNADCMARFLGAPQGNDLWEVILLAGSLGAGIETALSAQEPAFVAKFAFQLAQRFNLFYHTHHILSEEDPQKKTFLLLLADLVEKQLVVALQLLGIEAPEKM